MNMSREAVIELATAAKVMQIRKNLAAETARIFLVTGKRLEIIGHFLGPDRQNGTSPFGHGDDATVAISMLLSIASELISGSADLLTDGRHYAGSSLVRQLVEVEYLAWAFETKNEDAACWLRSDHDQRKNFFTPAKLRKAAGTKFRSVDYGHHCEFGGHPTPQSWALLNGNVAIAQLMLSDCLGHSGRIWDHIVGWARSHAYGEPVLEESSNMSDMYSKWKAADALTNLPPFPQ